jgi:hypothetical protein
MNMLKIAMVAALVVCATALTADAGEDPFFQCGFESDDRQSVERLTDKFPEGERNEIVAYADSPAPQLPGGGKRLVKMGLRKGVTDHPDFVWYMKKHPTRELYARFYFFLQDGHWEAPKGQGLKFFGIHCNGFSNSPFNQAMTKLLPVGDGDFKLCTTKLGNSRQRYEGENTIHTGKWHMIEVHVKIDPHGPDFYEAWLDRDSRSDEPSLRTTRDVIFPDQNGKFSRISNNKNSAGVKPPVNQTWFLDGLAASLSPIGDTYGLLKSQQEAQARKQSEK